MVFGAGETGEGAGVEGCPTGCERSHCWGALVRGSILICNASRLKHGSGSIVKSTLLSNS